MSGEWGKLGGCGPLSNTTHDQLGAVHDVDQYSNLSARKRHVPKWFVDDVFPIFLHMPTYVCRQLLNAIFFRRGENSPGQVSFVEKQVAAAFTFDLRW